MPVFQSCSNRRTVLQLILLPLCAVFCAAGRAEEQDAEKPPAWKTRLETARQGWRETVEKLDQEIAAAPQRVELYSRRGDAQFFLGRFPQAVADYDKMIELDPEQSASHWRRGIALFYAGRYKDAAAQFDKYHSFDDVDRENGIWRYLSHYRAYGKERARKELLKYEKDDREPFPAVYKLFAGQIEPDAILKGIAAADVPDGEQEKRRFYAQLYIGLNYLVEGQPEKSQQHLERMLPNSWGPVAGYGPHYMWQVGRIQWELNKSPNKDETDGIGINSSKSMSE